jgi:hypothetical protein
MQAKIAVLQRFSLLYHYEFSYRSLNFGSWVTKILKTWIAKIQRNFSAFAISKSLGARSLNFRSHSVKLQRIHTKLLSYITAKRSEFYLL